MLALPAQDFRKLTFRDIVEIGWGHRAGVRPEGYVHQALISGSAPVMTRAGLIMAIQWDNGAVQKHNKF